MATPVVAISLIIWYLQLYLLPISSILRYNGSRGFVLSREGSDERHKYWRHLVHRLDGEN